MADRTRSKRVSIALLIRKSSVRARRGPPRICAGQKLRICFRALPNRPEEGPKWHTLAHRVFESVGLQFEPGGANRRLCTSAARTRLRDLPNPPLSTGLWHICGTATCGTATTTRFGLRIEGALQARAALRTRRRTAGENLSPRPELPQVIPEVGVPWLPVNTRWTAYSSEVGSRLQAAVRAEMTSPNGGTPDNPSGVA